MYRFLLFILAVLVCLAGLSFHLRNEQLVHLDFYLGSLEYHFSVFILVSIIAGALLGILAMVPKYLSLKRQNMKLSKQLQLQNKEVNNLRAIPIKDSH